MNIPGVPASQRRKGAHMARGKDTTTSGQFGFEAELFKAVDKLRDKIANNCFQVAPPAAPRYALLPNLISARLRMGEVARISGQLA